MRMAGHECDRFVARGLECPFRKAEEEEDFEEEEEKQDRAFPQIIPVAERRKQDARADMRPDNVLQFSQVVGHREAMRGVERVAALQNVGGLQSIPMASQLSSLLSEGGVQSIFALLAALAVTASLLRGGGMRLSPQSLVVPASERHVAERLARPGGLFGETNRLGIRKFFGFGAQGGFDSFNETGFF